MVIELGYNQKKISVEVAPEHFGAILKLNDDNAGKCKKNAVEITKEAIKGSFRKFMALPGDVLVIVNDGTRPTPTRFVLDAIGEDLAKAEASRTKRVGVGLVPSFTITRGLPGRARKSSKVPFVASLTISVAFLPGLRTGSFISRIAPRFFSCISTDTVF